MGRDIVPTPTDKRNRKTVRRYIRIPGADQAAPLSASGNGTKTPPIPPSVNDILEMQDRIAQERHGVPYYKATPAQQEHIKEETQERLGLRRAEREEAARRIRSLNRMEMQECVAQIIFKRSWHELTDRQQTTVKNAMKADEAKERTQSPRQLRLDQDMLP